MKHRVFVLGKKKECKWEADVKEKKVLKFNVSPAGQPYMCTIVMLFFSSIEWSVISDPQFLALWSQAQRSTINSTASREQSSTSQSSSTAVKYLGASQQTIQPGKRVGVFLMIKTKVNGSSNHISNVKSRKSTLGRGWWLDCPVFPGYRHYHDWLCTSQYLTV